MACFFSPPISQRRNWYVVFSADFCQANVGHAKFLGKCSHGSGPDFFVEFGPSQANSCLAHESLMWLLPGLTFRRESSARELLYSNHFDKAPADPLSHPCRRESSTGSPRPHKLFARGAEVCIGLSHGLIRFLWQSLCKSLICIRLLSWP